MKRQGLTSQKAAQQALTAALAHVDGGRLLGAQRQTVGDFLASWLVSYAGAGRRKASTIQTQTTYVQAYLVPLLGKTLLRDLSPKIVSDALRQLLAEGRRQVRRDRVGLSAKTVRNVAGCLHKACGDAVKWGLLPTNPVAAVELPRYERPAVICWDSDQAATFLAHAAASGDPLYVLWRLLLVTGLRRGELLGLRWPDVDLVEATITVTQSRVKVDEGIVVSTPKTRAGRRTVSIDVTTRDLLAHLRNAQDAAAATLGGWPCDLVAVTAVGRPIHPQVLLGRWKDAARAAGVPVITLHQGRHTAITAALQRGTPVHVVAGRVGHAQASTTVNTYAHYLPRADRQAADVLGSELDREVAQLLRFRSSDVADGPELEQPSRSVPPVSAEIQDTGDTEHPDFRGSPGDRTQDLRIKSPLLSQLS